MYEDLGLSTASDAFQRASKQSVGFSLFRIFRGRIKWSPMTTDNLALFYGNNIPQRDAFISSIVKQVNKVSDSANIYLIDLTGDLLSLSESLTKTNRDSFTYKHFTGDLEGILKRLTVFRDEVRNTTKKERVIELTNRKLSFVFVNMSNEDAEILNKSEDARILIKDLITNSYRERLYFVPIVPYASKFPKDILETFQWCGFLGNENAKLCREELYPNMREGLYSIRQIISGIVFSNTHKTLVMIHPMKFTPSEWHIKREQQIKDENKAFNKFLEALDDGSIDG